MRPALVILTSICLAGCASKPMTISPPTHGFDATRYDEATSAALVFDPPVTANDPPLELSREDRMPSAFVSFDGPTTTFFWIHTDDLQDSDWNRDFSGGSNDRYQRRAIIDKVGESYR